MKLLMELDDGIHNFVLDNERAVHAAMKHAVRLQTLVTKGRTRAIIRRAWPRGVRPSTAIRSILFDDRTPIATTASKRTGLRDINDATGSASRRGRSFGKGGKGRGSMAGLVYSRLGRGKGATFIDYTDIHVRGGTIKAKRAGLLLIMFGRRAEKKFIGARPNFRSVGIVPVPIGNGEWLLFNVSRGKKTKGQAAKSKPIGILKKQVRIKKSLDFASVEAGAVRDLGPLFLKEYEIAMGKSA